MRVKKPFVTREAAPRSRLVAFGGEEESLAKTQSRQGKMSEEREEEESKQEKKVES